MIDIAPSVAAMDAPQTTDAAQRQYARIFILTILLIIVLFRHGKINYRIAIVKPTFVRIALNVNVLSSAFAASDLLTL